MAHGPGPDDDIMETNQAVASNDLAELAARQAGGLGAVHRGGRVMFASNMSEGLAIFPFRMPLGKGAKVAIDKTIAEFGNQSIRVTHGKTVGDKTTLRRTMPGGYQTKLGYELGIYNIVSNIRFYVSIAAINGTTSHEYSVMVTTNGTITNVAYLDQNNIYTPIFSNLPPMLELGFHNFKLIANERDDVYDSLWINGERRNMAGLLPRAGTLISSVFPGFVFKFILEARAAANNSVNLGSLILTIDEPGE